MAKQKHHEIPTPDRPHMPGYGISDDHEDLLPWSWVVERMEQARNYWICSTRPDGRPHAAPVWGVWLDGTFYFSTGRRSRKARNLATNPAVVVHLESGDETVIFEGVAEAITDWDAETAARYADTYDRKYNFRPDPRDAASPTYALRPRVAFAWTEREFPKSPTRWRFG
jgi:nitroimidazol reductase NimA-like FMN-containing flavoprotein (pyridoxamine 5'-phosphate oxidase superfamily)